MADDDPSRGDRATDPRDDRPLLTVAIGAIGILSALTVSGYSMLVGFCGGPYCSESFARGLIPWTAVAAVGTVVGAVSLWRTQRKSLRSAALALAGVWFLAAWPALGLVSSSVLHLPRWLGAAPLALALALIALAIVTAPWGFRPHAS